MVWRKAPKAGRVESPRCVSWNAHGVALRVRLQLLLEGPRALPRVAASARRSYQLDHVVAAEVTFRSGAVDTLALVAQGAGDRLAIIGALSLDTLLDPHSDRSLVQDRACIRSGREKSGNYKHSNENPDGRRPHPTPWIGIHALCFSMKIR
jgi:hypothetical protein